MFEGMTIFERIILESLEKNEKTLPELIEDTALNEKLIFHCLKNLAAKNIILIQERKYTLNYQGKEQWNQNLLQADHLKLELQELLEGMLNVALKKTPESLLKIRKVHMEEKDEMILKAMLINVENFLQELEKKSTRSKKTSHKKIVFTGMAAYHDILHCV